MSSFLSTDKRQNIGDVLHAAEQNPCKFILYRRGWNHWHTHTRSVFRLLKGKKAKAGKRCEGIVLGMGWAQCHQRQLRQQGETWHPALRTAGSLPVGRARTWHSTSCSARQTVHSHLAPPFILITCLRLPEILSIQGRISPSVPGAGESQMTAP